MSRERVENRPERLFAAAAALMAKQGYDQTTIRDVGRETGLSLAGMYYYFKSKEDLLFQIQRRTFASLLGEQEREQAAASGAEPEEKLRRLIHDHLSFFTRHANELKVCTFELESLKGEQYEEIEALRRGYFKLVAAVIEELLEESEPEDADRERRVRHSTLFLFGMLNWVFMWFDPERDGPVERLADEMIGLVLHGIAGARASG